MFKVEYIKSAKYATEEERGKKEKSRALDDERAVSKEKRMLTK